MPIFTDMWLWMAYRVQGNLPLLLFPARAEVLPEPLGTVLIFGSWNFPISKFPYPNSRKYEWTLSAQVYAVDIWYLGLTLDPLVGAISAGNTVVVKPSELAPACSSLICQTIPLYLDREAIRVVEGGSDVADKLLQQQWDKIFFTGILKSRCRFCLVRLLWFSFDRFCRESTSRQDNHGCSSKAFDTGDSRARREMPGHSWLLHRVRLKGLSHLSNLKQM